MRPLVFPFVDAVPYANLSVAGLLCLLASLIDWTSERIAESSHVRASQIFVYGGSRRNAVQQKYALPGFR